MRKEFKTVDLLKLISAFLVVGIHTNPFVNNVWCDRLFSLITRVPVPFFFTAAGFFFFLPNKGLPAKEKIKKYILRLFILYLIWSLIYLPFNLSRSDFDYSYIYIYSLIKSFLWGGICTHLWYFPALLTAVLLSVLLCKKISVKKVFYISLILYIIGTLYSTYSPVTNRFLNIETINYIIDKLGTRNGIFYGFFYFLLGGYITTFNYKKNIKYYWLCFISFILLATECLAGTYLHVSATILWFMTPFVVYNLFIIAITNEIHISDNAAKYIRNSSTLIYVSQFVFIYLLKNFMIPQYSLKMFCLTVLCCSLFSIVIIFLSKKIKMLKYLY